ncbi:MAG: pyruvate:ferredoxin (flavodoxin) oxidoreductase [Candidatus Hydrogenedentes bacterium]|nr:pyruvate:ferredoxin (flavodoxin) oxidoreductase [Candidatus Hydrogenedentota bacterium]
MKREMCTLDGNEAVATIAYQVNDVAAIYPITPSSPMGEFMDQWAAEGRKNIWGNVPQVVEMQSEAGAVGAVHGALQAGALTTTFTASQGLLLMIPNMYKIAGELTSTVFHVSARSIATHALSIFGDHSDVMAVRGTGFALLASSSVQEAMDFTLIAQAATLKSRVPFLHFFDGFRTSHEVVKVEMLTEDDIRSMIDEEYVRAHRERALNPDKPVIRGTAQNPDVYFQCREACTPFYLACPSIVQEYMDRFAKIAGRQYHLFDYIGADDADRIIILMGSGCEAVTETIDYLVKRGEKVGAVKVRLYRPFDWRSLISVIPSTVQKIAVLDRCKESGSGGEPLYLDVVNSFNEDRMSPNRKFETAPIIIGGRYGLSSKEFTPAMIKGVLDELKKDIPKNHFTVGIKDDVTFSSIDYDPNFSTEDPNVVRAIFFGLGSDGTVGANKNSIKIIGEETPYYAQGYFVYDSKKSGSMTISHLRFGAKPIHSNYLITRANFVACHQFSFIEKYDVLKYAEPNAVFLLNSPYGPDEVWEHLPRITQKHIVEKKIKFYVIDAVKVARQAGMGGRINTIMQTCFFAISGILPRDEAIQSIKDSIKKTYGKRGEAIVQKNWQAVDMTLEHLYEVKVPDNVTSDFDLLPPVPEEAPEFVKNVTAKIITGEGDELPVSAFPPDGTWPTATTKWEKRNIGLEIPVWDPEVCIQCGKCVLICPHAVIRAKIYDPKYLESAPPTFKSAEPKWKEYKHLRYTLQVSPEDCTGCGLCYEVCPSKSKQEVKHRGVNMQPQAPLRATERENWKFFESIPYFDKTQLNLNLVKDIQLLQPLFEFSGACAGCGETPYVKLVSQLYGDRMLVANATGCSSIYGGNLPTTPWTVDNEGRGPVWNNSLFEDNAEFGMGMRVALDTQICYAQILLRQLESYIGSELVESLLNADQSTEAGIKSQRERVKILKEKLKGLNSREAKELLNIADVLVKRSVWIMGGDGWAYDIGYGGLDHVIASNRDVNILVMDTEVYSNTGGQCSKATPRAAVAKFAAGGKPAPKKDLALMAMSYGTCYVARVAMGANDAQTIKAVREAEAYPGPSLIIAYCHCIAHGYNLIMGLEQQKRAVQTGHWPLIRFNPKLLAQGKNPIILDSKAPSLPLQEYVYNETRFKMLSLSNPDAAKKLLEEAQKDVKLRWKVYEHLASMNCDELCETLEVVKETVEQPQVS